MRSPEFVSSSRRALSAVSETLFSVLYPQECFVCLGLVESSDLGTACGSCWTATQLFDGSQTLCEKCGAFLSEKPSSFPTTCGRCSEHFYDAARAVGPYDGALRSAVINLKSSPNLSRMVREKLSSALERSGFSSVDLILSVPLSKKRLRERGHNQAEIIGRYISTDTGIGFDGKSLERTIHTPMHRAAMDRKARDMSVKNTFAVARPRLVENRRILLVDDVFTSGATASHCARLLKKSGADEVFVFTLARAVY